MLSALIPESSAPPGPLLVHWYLEMPAQHPADGVRQEAG